MSSSIFSSEADSEKRSYLYVATAMFFLGLYGLISVFCGGFALSENPLPGDITKIGGGMGIFYFLGLLATLGLKVGKFRTGHYVVDEYGNYKKDKNGNKKFEESGDIIDSMSDNIVMPLVTRFLLYPCAAGAIIYYACYAVLAILMFIFPLFMGALFIGIIVWAFYELKKDFQPLFGSAIGANFESDISLSEGMALVYAAIIMGMTAIISCVSESIGNYKDFWPLVKNILDSIQVVLVTAATVGSICYFIKNGNIDTKRKESLYYGVTYIPILYVTLGLLMSVLSFFFHFDGTIFIYFVYALFQALAIIANMATIIMFWKSSKDEVWQRRSLYALLLITALTIPTCIGFLLNALRGNEMFSYWWMLLISLPLYLYYAIAFFGEAGEGNIFEEGLILEAPEGDTK